MNPDWCTICDERLPASPSPAPGSTIIGGGARCVGDDGPWLLCEPSLEIVSGGGTIFGMLPPPKPNGKGERPDAPLPVEPFSRSGSLRSDDAEPLRFGLGGIKADTLGVESLEGSRGVNECEREWTCGVPAEVDGEGVSGGDIGEPWLDGGSGPRRPFLGGDVESSAETTGKGYFILNEDVDGEGIGDEDVAALLLTLSLRYVLIFW